MIYILGAPVSLVNIHKKASFKKYALIGVHEIFHKNLKVLGTNVFALRS